MFRFIFLIYNLTTSVIHLLCFDQKGASLVGQVYSRHVSLKGFYYIYVCIRHLSSFSSQYHFSLCTSDLSVNFNFHGWYSISCYYFIFLQNSWNIGTSQIYYFAIHLQSIIICLKSTFFSTYLIWLYFFFSCLTFVWTFDLWPHFRPEAPWLSFPRSMPTNGRHRPRPARVWRPPQSAQRKPTNEKLHIPKPC